MRGAWVEILLFVRRVPTNASLPVRGAWVEMFSVQPCGKSSQSLPVRGAWVEISPTTLKKSRKPVAPRAGSVG